MQIITRTVMSSPQDALTVGGRSPVMSADSSSIPTLRGGIHRGIRIGSFRANGYVGSVEDLKMRLHVPLAAPRNHEQTARASNSGRSSSGLYCHSRSSCSRRRPSAGCPGRSHFKKSRKESSGNARLGRDRS